MAAWGTEIPLHDLMGYTTIDFTVAAAAGSGSGGASPLPRALSMANGFADDASLLPCSDDTAILK